MICLFTDFGRDDPYVGQLHIAIRNIAADCPVIDLLHTAPAFDIRAAAYLLPAYTRDLPAGAVCACVVDPGVGSARPAVVYRVDRQWYVGPDNGLFELVCRRGSDVHRFRIDWRPPALSASFHGRDLFAPIAARLALGDSAGLSAEPAPADRPGRNWPDDLAAVVFVDHFGNAITALRGETVTRATTLAINGYRLSYAETFANVAVGAPFWYVNANGLVEIAANQAHAAGLLGIGLGDGFKIA